jgi:hypothetical protein
MHWMHQERNAGESKLSANQYKPLELRDAPMGMRKMACDAGGVNAKSRITDNSLDKW